MVLGDHPEAAGMGAEGGAESAGASHWVRWHSSYEVPSSGLSRRLAVVQSMVRVALDEIPGPATHPGPIRMVSLCAGQGRDVIDVVATHPRGQEVSALLVELDPALVAFARDRADEAGLGDRIRIVEGDASLARLYADDVPADIVLVCGVFGNISDADITHTIQTMRGFCVPRGHVIWTRHRRPPDLTPSIRADFAGAGFSELAFEAPENTVMTIGHHRLDGPTAPFDPDGQLFDFVGDGWNPV
jgi:SAM-dependent methyltransferase